MQSSLTETSLCDAYLYNKIKEVEMGKRCCVCVGDEICKSHFGHKCVKK
jgi:hypothetical protein